VSSTVAEGRQSVLAAKTPFIVASVVREDNWPKEHFGDRSLFTSWTSKAHLSRCFGTLGPSRWLHAFLPNATTPAYILPRASPEEARRPAVQGRRQNPRNLHHGKIEDAVVRAVIEHTDGLKLQVDFGHEQTAVIEEWQVVEWDLSRRVCPIPACSSWKQQKLCTMPHSGFPDSF
jgi:hypothetical protein